MCSIVPSTQKIVRITYDFYSFEKTPWFSLSTHMQIRSMLLCKPTPGKIICFQPKYQNYRICMEDPYKYTHKREKYIVPSRKRSDRNICNPFHRRDDFVQLLRVVNVEFHSVSSLRGAVGSFGRMYGPGGTNS